MKIILIDNSVILNRAILAWSAQQKFKHEGKIKKDAFVNSSTYTYFQIMIGLLKRVGVDKDDKVLLICDGRNSFRKAFYEPYKGQRRALREANNFVNWMEHWDNINKVTQQIDKATNFNVIFINKIWNWLDLLQTEDGKKYIDESRILDWSEEFSPEADDVIATAVQYYKNNECIIISSDADLKQLLVLPNVKFFTVMKKYQSKRGMYAVGENGYKILEKKLKSGDVGDNIIVDKNIVYSEKDKEIRKLIIDLINLPKWVQEPIIKILEDLPQKERHYEYLPFQKSLARRFPEIYIKKNVLTYEKCLQLEEKKKNKKLTDKEKKNKKVDTLK